MKNNSCKLIGKVANIPDEYTIVINVGSSILSPSNKVAVVEILGKIKDPDTQEDLGDYFNIKEILDVESTFEKYSICKKIVREHLDIFTSLSPILEDSQITKYEKVNVNPNDISGWIPEEDIVSIGDPVILLK